MSVGASEPIIDPARRALLVVAHPDDETIGAASLLLRRRCCRLIHVTNGAPRDARFRPNPAVSRQQYAHMRRLELTRALALAGLEARCATSLGVPDMEAVAWLDRIALRLASEIDTLQPDMIVTHDYAGGHPDHDAVAWAVAAACRLLARRGRPPPVIYEMPLYHGAGGGAGGRFCVGEFLPRAAGPEPVVIELSEPQCRRKRAMLDAFVSQRETLRPFHELEHERFRQTWPGADDYTRAPHAGALLYEQWGFPITGEHWRSLAATAARRLAAEHERAA